MNAIIHLGQFQFVLFYWQYGLTSKQILSNKTSSKANKAR